MSKYKTLVACASVCAIALTGCSGNKMPETIEETTIAVSDKGVITSYLVGSFDKEYYDISELTNMAVEEVAAYNTDKQEGETIPVTVVKVEELPNNSGNVMVTYQYDNADTYEDYNDGVLFYGTVSEALSEGYKLDASLINSIKDGTSVDEEWMLKEAGKRHILITNQAAQIYVPYKVTHVSQGAVYKEDGSVDTTQTEENVIILMKK